MVKKWKKVSNKSILTSTLISLAYSIIIINKQMNFLWKFQESPKWFRCRSQLNWHREQLTIPHTMSMRSKVLFSFLSLDRPIPWTTPKALLLLSEIKWNIQLSYMNLRRFFAIACVAGFVCPKSRKDVGNRGVWLSQIKLHSFYLRWALSNEMLEKMTYFPLIRCYRLHVWNVFAEKL